MKKIFLSAICLSLVLGCFSDANACFTRKNTVVETNNIISVKLSSESPYKNMSEQELNELVNRVGNKLLESNNVQKGVKFVVNTENVVNAYTDIEYAVTVYKGIIDYCSNEDELAFIIGHELGHADQNHVLKATGANYAGNMVIEAATKAAANKGLSSLAQKTAQIGTQLVTTAAQNKYSRSQEFTADAFGIDFMTKAGYNPLYAISIMSKFGENYADFWVDHPSTDKRLAAMSEHIRQNYPQFVK
ncbi:MAG: M48 family metallopeptidase [Candidatus Gastranaerophilales bacterium]|nr:M48 family metallopeptidase [Candidatus Gastranaerophilales bacterium]